MWGSKGNCFFSAFLQNCVTTPSPSLHHHHHYHHRLSLNRGGRWGTTDDFATIVLHFSLFSIALWDLANSKPVHSLMLSSHLFLCLGNDDVEWPGRQIRESQFLTENEGGKAVLGPTPGFHKGALNTPGISVEWNLIIFASAYTPPSVDDVDQST